MTTASDQAAVIGASTSQPPVIHVATAAELQAVLAAATDGQVIQLVGGDYGRLELSGYDRDITLLSDPDDPASFSHLDLGNVSGLSFDGVQFKLEFLDGYQAGATVFEIRNSQDITIRNATFEGDTAFGRSVNEAGQDQNGGTGLYIRGSQDITVEDSEISGFYRGVSIFGSDKVTLRGNDIHDIREDFIHMATVNDLLIENNHLHDRSKATDSGDHPDMIQLISKNSPAASTGLMIRGNVFDMGDGDPSQTIFMPNLMLDDRPDDDLAWYRDFVIEDNLIINGMPNGIIVGGTQGLVVRNNTVLGAEGKSAPNIRLDQRSVDVVVTGNVTEGTIGAGGEGWLVENNFRLTKTELLDHYLAAYGALAGHPEKLILDPDSPIALAGAGATEVHDGTLEALTALAVPIGQDNLAAYVFDGRLSAGPDGYADETGASFMWEFSDGTTAQGAVVTHVFSGPGAYSARLTVSDAAGHTAVTETEVMITGSDLVLFDPEAGVIRGFSTGISEILHDIGDKAIDFGELEGALGLKRAWFAPLFDAGDFAIDFGLVAHEGGTGGELLRLGGSILMSVTKVGELSLAVYTTEGRIYFSSNGAGLNDGVAHQVSLDYDAGSSSFIITVDGAVLGGTEAPGEIGTGGSKGISLGGAFGAEGFDGLVTGFALRTAPDSYQFSAASVPPDLDPEPDLSSAPEPDPLHDPAAIIDEIKAALPVIQGTDARDTLWAAKSGGHVIAGGGNDVLRGYGGNDVFTGGDGADKFVFDTRMTKDPTHDIVTDFDFDEGDTLHIYSWQDNLFEDARGLAPVSWDGSGMWFAKAAHLAAAIEAGVLTAEETETGLVLSIPELPGQSFELAFWGLGDFDLIA